MQEDAEPTDPATNAGMRLSVYRLNGSTVRLERAPAKRGWLPPEAYRCPPIVFANQLGYLLSLEGPLDLGWNGRPTADGIFIDVHGQPIEARADFAPGVATIFPAIVVKTPPGIGLLVKSVPNMPLGRVMVVEGFVESDWLEYTFNLSFKFLFPGRVQIPPRTPLCALVPYPTLLLAGAELEVFDGGPEHARVQDYADRYLQSRVDAAHAAARAGKQQLFESLYVRGRTLDGPRPENTAHARSPWRDEDGQ